MDHNTNIEQSLNSFRDRHHVSVELLPTSHNAQEMETSQKLQSLERTLESLHTFASDNQRPRVSEPRNVEGEAQTRNAFKNLMHTYAPSFEEDRVEIQENETLKKRQIISHLEREYEDIGPLDENSMSLPELKYELHRRRSLQEEQEHVEFMKSILLVALTAVEFVCKKMKIMKLDGWAKHAGKDMHKHERVLKVLHLRYFKKTMSDPVAELGWTLVGSMILYHFSTSSSEGSSESSGLNGSDIGNLMRLAKQFL